MYCNGNAVCTKCAKAMPNTHSEYIWMLEKTSLYQSRTKDRIGRPLHPLVATSFESLLILGVLYFLSLWPLQCCQMAVRPTRFCGFEVCLPPGKDIVCRVDCEILALLCCFFFDGNIDFVFNVIAHFSHLRETVKMIRAEADSIKSTTNRHGRRCLA